MQSPITPEQMADVVKRLDEIADHLARVDEKMGNQDKHLDNIDGHLATLNGKMVDTMIWRARKEVELEAAEKNINTIGSRVEQLMGEFKQEIKQEVQEINSTVLAHQTKLDQDIGHRVAWNRVAQVLVVLFAAASALAATAAAFHWVK